MAAATTGGSRWQGRTWCREPPFSEVTPASPVRDGLAPHAVNGVFSSPLVVVSPLETPVTPPRRQVPSVTVTFGGTAGRPEEDAMSEHSEKALERRATAKVTGRRSRRLSSGPASSGLQCARVGPGQSVVAQVANLDHGVRCARSRRRGARWRGRPEFGPVRRQGAPELRCSP